MNPQDVNIVLYEIGHGRNPAIVDADIQYLKEQGLVRVLIPPEFEAMRSRWHILRDDLSKEHSKAWAIRDWYSDKAHELEIRLNSVVHRLTHGSLTLMEEKEKMDEYNARSRDVFDNDVRRIAKSMDRVSAEGFIDDPQKYTQTPYGYFVGLTKTGQERLADLTKRSEMPHIRGKSVTPSIDGLVAGAVIGGVPGAIIGHSLFDDD